MIKFEYGVLKIEDSNFVDVYEFNGKILNDEVSGEFGYIKHLMLLEALNLIGEQGWELCNKVKDEGYVFKRKISDF